MGSTERNPTVQLFLVVHTSGRPFFSDEPRFMKWISKIKNRKKNSVLSDEISPALDKLNSSEQSSSIAADNPIQSSQEDTLGRITPAQTFASQILSIDSSKGVVVAVFGPWGSGKTSFVNLAREKLEESGVTILDFNPWMFSGADQLVESFFIELSAQLKIRPGMETIGELLESYGETFSGLGWVPGLGLWAKGSAAISKVLSKQILRKKKGVGGRRSAVQKSLGELSSPIVVVLDDIDRLTTSEIRHIFKLVRLTANFPNIIYLLAFDRDRIENALGEDSIPGRDYLEKIVQVGVDLPITPADALNSQIFAALDKLLENFSDIDELDQDVWPNVFLEVIRPLIKNMRDVRRYIASIFGSISELNTRVALADLLALESIRVFLPDVYRKMYVVMGAISAVSNSTVEQDSEELKKQIEELIEVAGDQGSVVQALLKHLFPAASKPQGGTAYARSSPNEWLREKRVAHTDVLRLYFERVEGAGLVTHSASEKAFSLMDDREALDEFLRQISIERLQDVVSALETYEDEFKPNQVVPALVVLFKFVGLHSSSTRRYV